MVRACSGRLLLCYCYFGFIFLDFTLQAKFPASLSFTPQAKYEPTEAQITGPWPSIFSRKPQGWGLEHTELAACKIKGYISVQSNAWTRRGMGKEAPGSSSGLLKIIGKIFLSLHLWAWFCSGLFLYLRIIATLSVQHCMGIKVLRNCYFHVMETCPFKCQNSVYFYHFLKIEIVLKYKIYYLS